VPELYVRFSNFPGKAVWALKMADGWLKSEEKKYRAVPVLCAVVLMVGTASAAFVRHRNADAKVRTVQLASGGTVEIRPLIIVPPIQQEPGLQSVPSRNPWFFPDDDAEEVGRFLKQAKLPEPLIRALFEKSEEISEGKGIVLSPSEEEVLRIPARSRELIYGRLARNRINHEQDCARRFSAVSVRAWLKHAGASEPTLKLADKLEYRNRPLIFFSDISLLLNRIEEPAERFAVYKALNQVKTRQLTIRVPENADIDGLVEYWGRGNRENKVRPLLEGIQQAKTDLEVIHLLPPLARQYLYNFPASFPERGLPYDCHWTAFNFFNWPPDPDIGPDTDYQELIRTEYVVIPQNQLQFGDLVLYLMHDSDKAKLIHSAVYICDGIVFTKNGNIWSSPWIFMTEREMDAYYDFDVPLDKMFIRRKADL